MDHRTHGHVLIELLNGFGRNDLKVAEIGVWKSHTLKRVLRKCGSIVGEYWAIDKWSLDTHWNYSNLTMEKWDELYFYACKMMYWFPQLHILRMDTIKASNIFPKDYFDLVFIDADHKYESVISDIKYWEPLVKNNGLLTGHDYGGSKIGVKKAVDECFDKIDLLDASVWVKKGGVYSGMD